MKGGWASIQWFGKIFLIDWFCIWTRRGARIIRYCRYTLGHWRVLDVVTVIQFFWTHSSQNFRGCSRCPSVFSVNCSPVGSVFRFGFARIIRSSHLPSFFIFLAKNRENQTLFFEEKASSMVNIVSNDGKCSSHWFDRTRFRAMAIVFRREGHGSEHVKQSSSPSIGNFVSFRFRAVYLGGALFRVYNADAVVCDSCSQSAWRSTWRMTCSLSVVAQLSLFAEHWHAAKRRSRFLIFAVILWALLCWLPDESNYGTPYSFTPILVMQVWWKAKRWHE